MKYADLRVGEHYAYSQLRRGQTSRDPERVRLVSLDKLAPVKRYWRTDVGSVVTVDDNGNPAHVPYARRRDNYDTGPVHVAVQETEPGPDGEESGYFAASAAYLWCLWAEWETEKAERDVVERHGRALQEMRQREHTRELSELREIVGNDIPYDVSSKPAVVAWALRALREAKS